MILEKFYKEFPINKPNDKLICNWLNIIKTFLKKHPEILVIMTIDKENVTVALNKDNSISRMEEVFSNKDTYEKIDRFYQKLIFLLTFLAC